MYKVNISNQTVEKIETKTFKNLRINEADVENIIRKNVDMLCDDDISMLIIGQQTLNNMNGRCDLVAIDDNGDLVLIEIKRDKFDVEHRNKTEPFELQAIRYAANIASIDSVDSLIERIYSPYIEKHKDEFGDFDNLSCFDYARKRLISFMNENDIKKINQHQRIVLICSDFPQDTLSSVAWLNYNNVDISCYKLTPSQYNEDTFLEIEKILPLLSYKDFYVTLKDYNENTTRGSIGRSGRTRVSLPKISDLIAANSLEDGDLLSIKTDNSQKATLQKNGKVIPVGGNNEISALEWTKTVTGWNSVNVYNYIIHEKTGCTLDQLRNRLNDSPESEETDPTTNEE